MTEFASPDSIDLDALPLSDLRTVVPEDVRIEGTDIVDIGAGTGRNAVMLARLGGRVIAVEPNARVIARLQPDGLPIRTVVAGGEEVALEPASLDSGMLFFSLHHIPRDLIAATLDNVHQALRPGGTIYIAEPVATGPAYRVGRIFDDETEVRRVALEILAKWLKKNPPASFKERLYRAVSTYADFEAYCASMIQVDERRWRMVEVNRDALLRQFETEAEVTPDGFALTSATRAIRIIF